MPAVIYIMSSKLPWQMEVLKSLHTFILYICSAKALANSSDFQLNVTTQGTAPCPPCLLAAHPVQMTCKNYSETILASKVLRLPIPGTH